MAFSFAEYFWFDAGWIICKVNDYFICMNGVGRRKPPFPWPRKTTPVSLVIGILRCSLQRSPHPPRGEEDQRFGPALSDNPHRCYNRHPKMGYSLAWNIICPELLYSTTITLGITHCHCHCGWIVPPSLLIRTPFGYFCQAQLPTGHPCKMDRWLPSYLFSPLYLPALSPATNKFSISTDVLEPIPCLVSSSRPSSPNSALLS